MGFFNLFGRKKTVELDIEKDRTNKSLMRDVFDKAVENGSAYKIVYAYSEDVKSSNFLIRTVSYKYRNLLIGFNDSDLSLAFLEVSPDLSQAGEPVVYKPTDIKKTNFIKFTGTYYLQYGSAIKKEFFNFFVPESIDDIVGLEWYEEDRFIYVDQKENHAEWVSFWNKFSK